MYCVREFKTSFSNRLIFNLSHFEEASQADSYSGVMISKKNKAIAEKLDIADGGFAFKKDDKYIGSRSVVRVRKGNSFIELKYQHSKSDKPFCTLDNMKSIATAMTQKL